MEQRLPPLTLGTLGSLDTSTMGDRTLNDIQAVRHETAEDVKLWHVVDEMVKFLHKTLQQTEIKEAWEAEELNINFKGQAQTGEDLTSSYPNKCLILLSNGPLQDDLKNHQGKMWECGAKCRKADNRQSNIFNEGICSIQAEEAPGSCPGGNV